VILKRGGNIKYLPYVFTEHGAVMAANVLSSPHAVRMSVYVVRAFIRLRHTVELQRDIMVKLEELERAVTARDSDIKRLFAALRQLMAPPDPKNWISGRRKSRCVWTTVIATSIRRFENSRNLKVPVVRRCHPNALPSLTDAQSLIANTITHHEHGHGFSGHEHGLSPETTTNTSLL
jgi:hypothetical protein